MKKVSLIICIIFLIVSAVAGCGSPEKSPTVSGNIKLALILDPASAVDEQYNHQLETTVKKAADQYRNRLTAEIIRIPGNGIDRKKYIDEQLSNGKYDLVIDSDLYYTRNVVELAEKYPQTKFGIVDEDIAEVGKNSNLLLLSYNAFQEGFVAGYSAGIKAKTAVAIVALKGNPNSYKLIKGFRAGIEYANKSLKIIKKDIELQQYNVSNVFDNEQKLRNEVFNSVKQAVSEGADVVLPDSLIPIAPVIAAVQNSPALIVSTEIEYSSLVKDPNYLSCIVEDYEFGINQLITRVLTGGFKGGKLEMNFLNEGLKFSSVDKDNQAACERLIKELVNNPKLIANLEVIQ